MKVSQKIDSFMASLGVNVGHTGGSMLAEAMMRKRQTFYFDLDPDGMYRVYEGRIVQARVIAVAEKVVRVEVRCV